jgi:hypothetical protein
MAGAICINRTIALEAREEHKAVDVHIRHIEKDIRSTKEFLLLPNQGLDLKLKTIQLEHNTNLNKIQKGLEAQDELVVAHSKALVAL